MNENQEQVTGSGRHSGDPAPVRVECYAGYRAEEIPRRFFIGRREIRVIETIDRWLAPQQAYFKVRGDDDGIYILRYEQDADRWDMILYNSGTHDATRLSST